MDNTQFIASANDFLAKSLTEECIDTPVRGKIPIPEAIYDFALNWDLDKRSSYYAYVGMKAFFLGSSPDTMVNEMDVVLTKSDAYENYNAKVGINVSHGYAPVACAGQVCTPTQLRGGDLPIEEYMKLETKEFVTQARYCLDDFKYLRDANTMGYLRSAKDLLGWTLGRLQSSHDWLRALMFYGDGSSIVAEIKQVITGNVKFETTRNRPPIFLRDNDVYAVFRPRPDTDTCTLVDYMDRRYRFMGFVEINGLPDLYDRTFYIKPSTDKVSGTAINAPILQKGDVLVTIKYRDIPTPNSVENTAWTPVDEVDGEGYQKFSSCAVEGIRSICNYVNKTEYKCISTEKYPMFKAHCESCCDPENPVPVGEDPQCKVFNPNMVWSAIQRSHKRTMGAYGPTVLLMNGTTYEAIRLQTIDDARFTIFKNYQDTPVDIGNDVMKWEYTTAEGIKMKILIDENMPDGHLFIAPMNVFQRINPIYSEGYYRKNGRLAFVPTQAYKTQGSVIAPDFICFIGGVPYIDAMAKWETEFTLMIPSAVTYLTDICTDFANCDAPCRNECDTPVVPSV